MKNSDLKQLGLVVRARARERELAVLARAIARIEVQARMLHWHGEAPLPPGGRGGMETLPNASKARAPVRLNVPNRQTTEVCMGESR